MDGYCLIRFIGHCGFGEVWLCRSEAMGDSRQVRQDCQLTNEGSSYLEHAMEEMNFSARSHDRILKVARTLADLSGPERNYPNEILEAIQFQSLDRKFFRDCEGRIENHGSREHGESSGQER